MAGPCSNRSSPRIAPTQVVSRHTVPCSRSATRLIFRLQLAHDFERFFVEYVLIVSPERSIKISAPVYIWGKNSRFVSVPSSSSEVIDAVKCVSRAHFIFLSRRFLAIVHINLVDKSTFSRYTRLEEPILEIPALLRFSYR